VMLAFCVSGFILLQIALSCPIETLIWQNNCYYISYDRLKWEEAESFCAHFGNGNGHLASIENVIEANFITDKLGSMDGADNVWSGGNNLEDGMTWVWSDGKRFNYTNWKPGSPNNLSDNQCIVVDKTTGKWSNENCHQPKRFMCKFSQTSNPSSTIIPPSTSPMRCPSCKTGYEMYQGFCYKIVNVLLTWNEAENGCVQEGGHLASVHSIVENNFIRGLVLAQPADPTPDGCIQAPWLWIGFNDPLHNLNYTWSDGTNVTLTNWYPGYPAALSCGSAGVYCAIMGYDSGMNAKWWTKFCTTRNAFSVCKMPTQ